MDHGLDPKALAAAKLEARQRRRKTLRRRIATGSITLFLAAWATVFGQAALSARSTQIPGQSPDPTLSGLVSGLSDDQGGSPAPVVSSQTAPVSPQPAPVTSSQS